MHMPQSNTTSLASPLSSACQVPVRALFNEQISRVGIRMEVAIHGEPRLTRLRRS